MIAMLILPEVRGKENTGNWSFLLVKNLPLLPVQASPCQDEEYGLQGDCGSRFFSLRPLR
jgi:hypothetical protein